MQPQERSTYLAAEARRHDPDRYLCALLAPAERRDAVLGLVLLHHELARIPDLVSQPMAGYIRYQWWRDAIAELGQGRAPRQHPVVMALAEPLRAGWVEEGALQALIDAREQALEGVTAEDLPGLERYMAATSGALQALTYGALGGQDATAAAAAAKLGAAFGLVGVIRAVAHEARSRRTPGHQGFPHMAGGSTEALARATGEVRGRVEALVAAGRAGAGRPARAVMAAFLPGALAAGYAARLRRLGDDPYRAAELRRPPSAPLTLLARTLLRRP